MAVKLNGKGASHAAGLIGAGKVTKGQTWSGPSSTQENTYIKENGMSKYGQWFLGVETSAAPDIKEHYKYPYTSDFQTVNYAGLIAIRQRSAQQGATDIFNRAGELIKKINPEKKKAKAFLNMTQVGNQKVAEIIVGEDE